ncbi:ubiquitin carboxyl-terminal hydrolase [Apophysomyces sp. BC1034]|nr:ubiquitin carboxyl-terminal hydrolase [Apophysomyces sp. BC1021]KAG0188780.1 ubiquitin carboxyl-terminal hydrolase [Apophysomyces sp. BC1034]
MAREYGVKEVVVEELLSLDFDELTARSPVLGLIFASSYEEEPLPEDFDKEDPDQQTVVFSCQVITNVCATLALLGVLLNCHSSVDIGDCLRTFKEFTAGFDGVTRGMAIGNSEKLRVTHNSFASAQMRAEAGNYTETKTEGKAVLVEEDVYHYVSYVPIGGYVWELDGMKKYPVKLVPCNETNWLESLKPIVQKRLNCDMKCSLMAVVQDPSHIYEKELHFNDEVVAEVDKVLEDYCGKKRTRDDEADPLSEVENPVKRHVQTILNGAKLEAAEKSTIASEKIKELHMNEQRNQMEIQRRRHDYTQFLECLITKLHEKGTLQQIL